MRSSAVELAVLKMRQQAPSEDREVLIAQSLEQQGRQRVRRGQSIERPLGTTSSPKLRVMNGY